MAKPSIAVVIPSYRVKRQILEVIATIPELVQTIIVVDDRCPDASGRFVEENCSDPRVKVLSNDVNRGVGGATMTGFSYAIQQGAEILVKMDGDGQMDPQYLPELLQPVIKGDADYTKGNRFQHLAELKRMPPVRRYGNLGLSFLTKLSSGHWDIFDPTNGYIALHANVARRLPFDEISQRYFFESDLLFHLKTLSAKVVDVPMPAIYGDEESNLSVSSAVPEFFKANLRNLGKRIVNQYFVGNLNAASIQLAVAFLLTCFSMVFGFYQWGLSIFSGTPATAGTVMLAGLPMITAIQLFISFLNYDLASKPGRAIHPQLSLENDSTGAENYLKPLPDSPAKKKQPASEKPIAPLNRLHVGTIFSILCLGLLIRFHYFTGPVGSDDLRYIPHALKLLSATPLTEIDHAAGRLAFLAYVGIFYKMGDTWSHAAMGLFVATLLRDLVTIGFCAKRLGPGAAILAACILCLDPISFAYSSMTLPDPLLSLLLVSGMLAFVEGLSGPKASSVWLGLGAVIMGAAFQVKEPAALAMPFLGLGILFKQKSLRPTPAVLAFVGGFFGTVLLEWLVFQLWTGDPLYRWHSIASRHNSSIQSVDLTEYVNIVGSRVSMMFRGMSWALVPCLLGFPAFIYAFIRIPKLRVLAASSLCILLFLTVGSSSFSEIKPLPFQPRYLQPLVAPSALCLAAIVTRIWKPFLYGLSVVFLLIGVNSTSFAESKARRSYYAGIGASLASLEEHLSAVDSSATIYFDPTLFGRVRPFLKHRGKLSIARLDRDAPSPKGWIIILEGHFKHKYTAEQKARFEELKERSYIYRHDPSRSPFRKKWKPAEAIWVIDNR